MFVVSAAVGVLSLFVRFADWVDVLPGRHTQRILDVVLLVSLFVAFTYDPEAALRPFLEAGERAAKMYTKMFTNGLSNMGPSTSTPPTVP